MLIKKLEKNGFKVIGHKGSHVMLSDGLHYTEAPKHSKELPKGLERVILKQAGLQ
ncbi:type II toxin-antitoxin system HicA family toxin [uncultured Fructobacillus sp.]|uniref:type II toxin-antitoxin system HicA family toxin n=1 Tax=Fructobacillus cardui TaxID=2893170 RepID=UPI002592CA3D|nr:type II toxin-antitoxin system HicA family toxin [uncultured Fructobacillus sp.]